MSIINLISILLIFLAVGLYGVLHSWTASQRIKAEARFRLGSLADHSYRLFYNLLAVVTLLPVLALIAFLPDRRIYTIWMPFTLLSLTLQGVALLFILFGVFQTGIWSFLGLHQLFAFADQPGHLVTNGLYHYIRHPLYSAGLALIWMTPVMTVNILALNIGLTIYILIGIKYEERKLLREFGPVYEAYRQQTPMLVPNLNKRTPVITQKQVS